MGVLHTTISTTIYSNAYLVRAWEQRSSLTEYERYGFAQFFYLTLTSHVEATINKLVEHRLMSIRSMAHSFREKSITSKKDGQDISISFAPIYSSLKAVMKAFEKKAETATLEKIKSVFSQIFDIDLKNTLGDLNSDLEALAKLRNIFAHGNDLWLQFEQTEENRMSLDKNPLQLPAQRLLTAGILKNLRFDGRNNHEFMTIFYHDDAMLYFLDKSQKIELTLKSFCIPFETELPFMIFPLPDLKAIIH